MCVCVCVCVYIYIYITVLPDIFNHTHVECFGMASGHSSVYFRNYYTILRKHLRQWDDFNSTKLNHQSFHYGLKNIMSLMTTNTRYKFRTVAVWIIKSCTIPFVSSLKWNVERRDDFHPTMGRFSQYKAKYQCFHYGPQNMLLMTTILLINFEQLQRESLNHVHLFHHSIKMLDEETISIQ